MELFEEIRREYEFGVGTILGVARKLGVHRRMVREALGNAVPARRKKPERKRPRLAPVMPFIDAILESDRAAPRKQWHTAHRIYLCLRGELPNLEVAESTVRRCVREKKGYVPMADVGAKFLFQVVAERAEKAAVFMTTNLPFSGWTQVIPNSWLYKALPDRVTDRANVIETGSESYRFRRTIEKRKKEEGLRPIGTHRGGRPLAGVRLALALRAPPFGFRRALLHPEPPSERDFP